MWRAALAGAVTGAVAQIASAGPDHVEGNDAGSTPAGSQKVSGTGPVTSISGNLAGGALNGPTGDFEDMYLILITDAQNFRVCIEPKLTGFDGQLWLFAAAPTLSGGGGGRPGEGQGLLGNKDSSDPLCGALLLPASDDGTGVSIEAGLYYLAISGKDPAPGPGSSDRVPQSSTGDIFFFPPMSVEISGPDGPGGSMPIASWAGNGGTGSYILMLDGVSFIPTLTSADGLWTADIDDSGQIEALRTPNQPETDNLLETLVYEASTHSGLLSRRVESNYLVTSGPVIDLADTHSFTRLEKNGAPISIEIENFMLDGPDGGVRVDIRVINKDVVPVDVRLFYYCNINIGGVPFDDEAVPIFDAVSGRLVAIEQANVGGQVGAPLWFGGCPNYDGWEIDLAPTLQIRLDGPPGVPDLLSVDFTPPGLPADHTSALAGPLQTIPPGGERVLTVGIGGPGINACPEQDCPADFDNSGGVDIVDLLMLLSAWGTSDPMFDVEPRGGDGIVSILDLLFLLSAWGPC